jgi:ABC-type transporter Mla subunit MlaD
LAAIERLAGEVAGLRSDMRALTQGLGLMLDAQATHTAMLRQLLEAATADPGPSPIAETLQEILSVLTASQETLESLATDAESLPERVAQQLADALVDAAYRRGQASEPG